MLSTVQRFIATGLVRGGGKADGSIDGEPGHEIDFARLGFLHDDTGRRRTCHALIFTAVFSRHMFVWLSFTQTTETCDRRVRGGGGGSSAGVFTVDPRQPHPGRDEG